MPLELKEPVVDRPYSILLVDDKHELRVLLSRRLEQAGYLVTPALNGRHALQLLALERFDLVLLDIEMPEMDGLATLAAMKGDERLAAIPVVMITATSSREAVVECLSLGAADYLIKPVNPLELTQRVHRCLTIRAIPFEPTVQLGDVAGSRVLIVDDEPLNLKLLDRRLAQMGYHAVSAADGRQALELLARGRFDAVLLDVQMPEMNGFEVLRAIRANPAWSGMPVLMLSADGSEVTIDQCYRDGADDYLVKPYHTPDLQMRRGVPA
ncbi:MAG: PleD family two-component system response regulator [Thiobacillus sp.]